MNQVVHKKCFTVSQIFLINFLRFQVLVQTVTERLGYQWGAHGCSTQLAGHPAGGVLWWGKAKPHAMVQQVPEFR